MSALFAKENRRRITMSKESKDFNALPVYREFLDSVSEF